mmetsp:Transcript_47232/g.135374  ORF Transcript_47232/g.135374 Transcript_47232/m.135374 type:complete len:270 (-) Transcript_47232:71-880(-)
MGLSLASTIANARSTATPKNGKPASLVATSLLSTAEGWQSAFLVSSSVSSARNAEIASVCTVGDSGNCPRASKSSTSAPDFSGALYSTAAAWSVSSAPSGTSIATATTSCAAAFLLPSFAVHTALRAIEAAKVAASSPANRADLRNSTTATTKPASRRLPRLTVLCLQTSGMTRQKASMASPCHSCGGPAKALQMFGIPSKSLSKSRSPGVARMRRPMLRMIVAKAAASSPVSSAASTRSSISGISSSSPPPSPAPRSAASSSFSAPTA